MGIGHSDKKWGSGGFGSTGQAVIFLNEKILESRSTCQVNISGKNFQGLLDTGAYVFIINFQYWPKTWPTRPAPISVAGLRQTQGLKQSAMVLSCSGPDKQPVTIQPYIADIPINLCSHDLLEQWHAEIHIPPNHYSHQIMFNQGYIPELGLGKNQQENLTFDYSRFQTTSFSLVATSVIDLPPLTPIPLNWKTDQPVWIEQ